MCVYHLLLARTFRPLHEVRPCLAIEEVGRARPADLSAPVKYKCTVWMYTWAVQMRGPLSSTNAAVRSITRQYGLRRQVHVLCYMVFERPGDLQCTCTFSPTTH